MNQKYRLMAIVAVAVALIIGAGYYYYGSDRVGNYLQPTINNDTGSNVNNESPIEESAADSGYVEIKNFAFSPKAMTVKAGSIVTWENKDNASHTIKSIMFVSSEIPQNYKFKYQFIEPGTYEYSCGLHPNMKGTIIVK